MSRDEAWNSGGNRSKGEGRAGKVSDSSQMVRVENADSNTQFRDTESCDVAANKRERGRRQAQLLLRTRRRGDGKCVAEKRRELVSWQPNCGYVLKGLQHRAHNLLELEQPKGLKSNSEGKN